MDFVIQYIRNNFQLPTKGKDRAMPLKWKQGENLHWMAFGLAFVCAVIALRPSRSKTEGSSPITGISTSGHPVYDARPLMVLEGNFGWTGIRISREHPRSYSFYFMFSPFSADASVPNLVCPVSDGAAAGAEIQLCGVHLFFLFQPLCR
jgi:hypothetical protein